MTDQDEFKEVRDLLKGPGTLGAAKIVSVTPLAGDASSRRFSRVTLTGAGVPPSIILLEYGDSKGPSFPGSSITQEKALTQLAPYFSERGVPVSKLLRYQASTRRFLFEDLGDRALAHFAHGTLDDAGEHIKDLRGIEYLQSLFGSAIDLIAQLQSLPHDPRCVAFQRGLAFENYRKEISEFLDFYLVDKNLVRSAAEVINKIFDAICETVIAFPKALSHFDFHGFNILVDDAGKLRLIDYQDACLVSHARDLISLINDRDMDSYLGQTRHSKLLSYYFEKLKVPNNFHLHYNLTLLHWDLRVAGRFMKLRHTKNTDKYLQWLPGTLRRIGRTLQRSHSTIHGMDDLLDILVKVSGEVREGFESPWPLPNISLSAIDR